MNFFLTAFISLGAYSLFAQAPSTDASMMMQPTLSGTARSLGMGGAFSSVGADLSCLNSNPAGIALYTKSELAVSGRDNMTSSSSNYLSQLSKSDYSKFTFSQGGFVFASKKLSKFNNLSSGRNGSKLDRVVFGFGFQKIADFSGTQYFYGTNTQNSYAQGVAAILNSNTGLDLSSYNGAITNANEGSLVRFDSVSNKYLSTITQPLKQIGSLTTQGSLRDINLTVGFNIGNTIFIGIGAGLPYMSYNSYYSYTESTAAGDSSSKINYNHSISGLGVNGKLGLIIKPTKWIRIGASFQSPTYFHLSQNANSTISTKLGDSTNNAIQNNLIEDFKYYNPLKAIFGVSFYVKQWIFISIDYEMNNYSATRFSDQANQNLTNYWNSITTSDYKISSTLKGGVEIIYKKLHIRGGAAWSQSPVRTDSIMNGYNSARFNYTAGLGLRGKAFFADIAYVHTEYKNVYTPYSYKDAATTQEPVVYSTFANNAIIVTLGLKFGNTRERSFPSLP